MLTMLIPQVHSQVETLLFKQKEHPVCNIIWRVGQLKMVRHLSGLEGWCPNPLQMRLARIPPGKRGGHGNPVTARLQAPVTLLQQQWKKYTYHHTYLNCRGGWVGQATRKQASNSVNTWASNPQPVAITQSKQCRECSLSHQPLSL